MQNVFLSPALALTNPPDLCLRLIYNGCGFIGLGLSGITSTSQSCVQGRFGAVC